MNRVHLIHLTDGVGVTTASHRRNQKYGKQTLETAAKLYFEVVHLDPSQSKQIHNQT
jgi:hypothetical protein